MLDDFPTVLLYTLITISTVFLATLTPVASTELGNNSYLTDRNEILNEILKISYEAETLIQITRNLYNNAISGNKNLTFDEEVKTQDNNNKNITNEDIQNIMGLLIPSLDQYIKEFKIIENIELKTLCKIPWEYNMECHYPKRCVHSGSIDVPYCCLKTTIKKLKEIKSFLIMLFGNIRKDVNHSLKNYIIPFSFQEEKEFTMTILRKTSVQLDNIENTLKQL